MKKKLTKEQVTRLTRAFEALGCAQACLIRAMADIGFHETFVEIRNLVTEAQMKTSSAQTRVRSKLP